MNMITTLFKGLFQPKNGILFIGNEGRGVSKIVTPEGINKMSDIEVSLKATEMKLSEKINAIDGVRSLESQYLLKFRVGQAKWMLNSDMIPTAEKELNDYIGFSIQSFNNGNFLFCVHLFKGGNVHPSLDEKYYQQIPDKIHGTNKFGSVETMERCINYLIEVSKND